jgi:glycosyltransferase involved in cell wall biosynthesis
MMRITFVLPRYLASPAGGFKMVYEYANRLQARNHQITILHPRNLEPMAGIKEWVKSRLWPYKIRLRNYPLVPWFKLNEGIKLLLPPDLREDFVPPGEAIIATGYRTAFWVNRYREDKGRKYYLIQHYETWDGEEKDVNRTWILPLHKIVIAKWLLKLATEFGESERATYIPNGLDFEQFKIIKPIEDRPERVGMLAHISAWKGTSDGVRALSIARERLPNIQAILFGTHPRPAELPEWIEYRQQPTAEELVAIYNSCSVFLQPSWTEGWGLTAAEAMACGCALVTTDNLGVREFAENGYSALISPIKSPDLLAQNLLRLLNNDDLRRQLAQSGYKKIQEFTWEQAVNSLERLFLA